MATDPLDDRDLDVAIAVEVMALKVYESTSWGWRIDDGVCTYLDSRHGPPVPLYSTDGEDMLSLLQRFSSVTFDGHEGPPAYWHVAVWNGHGHTMPDGKAKGATPGVALCLAALAAVRATKVEPDHADD